MALAWIISIALAGILAGGAHAMDARLRPATVPTRTTGIRIR